MRSIHRRGSPALPAGLTLKRAHDVVGDPTTIKMSRLGLDLLAVYVADVHQMRIEGDVVADGGEGSCRGIVSPGGVAGDEIFDHDVKIPGNPFPLAKCLPIRGLQDTRL
jgi:hypothetical protein